MVWLTDAISGSRMLAMGLGGACLLDSLPLGSLPFISVEVEGSGESCPSEKGCRALS